MSLALTALDESSVCSPSPPQSSNADNCLTRTPSSKKEAIDLFSPKLSCTTSNITIRNSYSWRKDFTKYQTKKKKMTLAEILNAASLVEAKEDEFSDDSDETGVDSGLDALNAPVLATSDSTGTFASATPSCVSAPPTTTKTAKSAHACPATSTTVSTVNTGSLSSSQRYSMLLSSSKSKKSKKSINDLLSCDMTDNMSISSRDYFQDEESIVLCAPDSYMSSTRQKLRREDIKRMSLLTPKLLEEEDPADTKLLEEEDPSKDEEDTKEELGRKPRDQSRSKRRSSYKSVPRTPRQTKDDHSSVACHSAKLTSSTRSSRRPSSHQTRYRIAAAMAADSCTTSAADSLKIKTNDSPAVVLYHLETAVTNGALSIRALSRALLKAATSSTEAAADMEHSNLPRISIALAALKEIEGVLKQYTKIQETKKTNDNYPHDDTISNFSQLPPFTEFESGQQRSAGSNERKSRSSSTKHRKAACDIDEGERSHSRKSRSHSLSAGVHRHGQKSSKGKSNLHESDGKLLTSSSCRRQIQPSSAMCTSKHNEYNSNNQEEEDETKRSGSDSCLGAHMEQNDNSTFERMEVIVSQSSCTIPTSNCKGTFTTTPPPTEERTSPTTDKDNKNSNNSCKHPSPSFFGKSFGKAASTKLKKEK